MHAFTLTLRIIAPVFFVVGALHLTLGLGADALLGAELSTAVRADPVLDSQNRFYAIAFTLYGALLWLCAGDLPRYAPVLRTLLWVFFAAGAARLVSIATHGLPGPLVLGLLGSELLLPPVLLWWLRRLRPSDPDNTAR